MSEHTETARLLDSIVETFNRYVVLPEHGPETIALYIVFTHLIEHAAFAPMLVFSSPVMRCGKTTSLDLVTELVYRALGASNASPSALFRAVEDYRPTLILDEVDAFLRQKNDSAEAIRGILNSGHRRGKQATVLRTVPKGNDFELRQFSTFCPKVLAGIGNLASTLRDRSIILQLRRKLPDERVERLRIARVAGDLEELRLWIEQTAAEIAEQFSTAYPEAPAKLSDRSADNWEHLLAIADIAGGEWPQRARRAAVALSGGDDEAESARVLLLGDTREYFAETDQAAAPTNDLLGHLNDMETRPWGTWHNDRNMTARDLAKMLKPFGVEPKQVKLDGAKTRGYRREDFADAWRRYLPDPGNIRYPGTDDGNSQQDNDLDGTVSKKGTGTKRYQEPADTEGYRQVPVPEKDPVPHNSQQDIDLRETVPGYRQNPGSGGTEQEGDPIYPDDIF